MGDSPGPYWWSNIIPIISASDICINPVNWRTDATPAMLHDTITITVSPEHHVLVATNYSASEYAPFRDFLNVGDIHSCSSSSKPSSCKHA